MAFEGATQYFCIGSTEYGMLLDSVDVVFTCRFFSFFLNDKSIDEALAAWERQ